MMKRLTYILLSGALVCACVEEPTGPTIKVPDEMSEGSRIDAPDVRIIDIRTDGFTADWETVSDAASYEYSFDGGEPVVTDATSLTFDSLEVDTEHILKMRSLPRKESGRIESVYVTVNVVTSELLPLDMPDLQFGSTYSSVTVISWGVVPGAASYDWVLSEVSGGIAGEGNTTKTFVSFEGLLEGGNYTLKVRALSGTNDQKIDSDWSEVAFSPTSDGTDKMFFSNFSASCDGISFDVYASSAQYYIYDIIPKLQFDKYVSEEAYLDSLQQRAEAEAQELTEGGRSRRDAFAQILNSGSATIRTAAYSKLTYSVCVMGMTLDGMRTADFKRVELTTPADTETDGAFYLSPGGWFTQSLSLGSSSTDPSVNGTNSIRVTRKGSGVTSVKYKLYTSTNFARAFGTDFSDSAISDLISTLAESTGEVTEASITKINGAGVTSSYSKLTPGTDYTVAALATNEQGKQILSVNSIRTRTSTEDIYWITSGYVANSITTSGFTIRVRLRAGMDAVSARYYVAPASEVSASYTKEQYPELVESKGTALTASEIENLCKSNGYFDIAASGLESGTSYLIIIQVTNSTGDTLLKSSSLSTK